MSRAYLPEKPPPFSSGTNDRFVRIVCVLTAASNSLRLSHVRASMVSRPAGSNSNPSRCSHVLRVCRDALTSCAKSPFACSIPDGSIRSSQVSACRFTSASTGSQDRTLMERSCRCISACKARTSKSPGTVQLPSECRSTRPSRLSDSSRRLCANRNVAELPGSAA